MFFKNQRNVQRSTHSSEPTAGTMYVDNEVRSAVALEFSRMEQQHARLREEALAALASAAPQSEPSDRELS
jgi:hypothetical protein